MIPFPPFEPDKADYNEASGDTLVNCLPVADGWGPMADFVVRSEALPADCVGKYQFKAVDGTLSCFAGTTTDLYKLDTSANPYTWTNVSKSAAAYSVPPGDEWKFTRFGSTLIAHSLGGPAQYIDLASGTAFADLGGSPPIAKTSAVVGDFLVFGQLSDNPSATQWSGINDPTYWVKGQRGSDIQIFPEGGEVQAIIPVGLGAIIVQRDAMQEMQFSPSSSYTFSFASANPSRGAVSSRSVVNYGPGQFAYISEQGFFVGVAAQPIGAERIDRWFFSQIELDALEEVAGFLDPYNKIIWWRFETPAGTARLLGWDWQLDRWCLSDQDFQTAGAIATPAISIDGMDSLYATIDDVDEAFDSRIFKGGRPVFAIINTDRKLAFMGTSPKSATLETAAVALNPGGWTRVHDAFVIGDCTDYTCTVSVTDRYGGSFTAKDPVSPSTRTGRLPVRASGRLHKFKITTTAGASWETLSGIEVIAEMEGRG